MPKVTDRGSRLTHSHAQSPRVPVMESSPTFLQQPPRLLAQAATFQTGSLKLNPLSLLFQTLTSGTQF